MEYSKEYKGYRIDIIPENECNDPREIDDCLTKIYCFHRQYNIGDNHEYKSSDFNNWDEFKQALMKHDICFIEPLYMYEHSGITINTTPFSCHWDSGQIGYVFVTKEDIKQEFNCKRISKRILQVAKKIMDDEINIYKHYLEGNIYGFAIYDTNKKPIDYCGGFITDNLDMLYKEAINQIDRVQV